MGERLNMIVDDGVSELLTELAGGERKRGQFISNLVRAMHDQRETIEASDLEQLRMAFAGMVGTIKMFEGRLIRLESNVAAMMAGETSES